MSNWHDTLTPENYVERFLIRKLKEQIGITAELMERIRILEEKVDNLTYNHE